MTLCRPWKKRTYRPQRRGLFLRCWPVLLACVLWLAPSAALAKKGVYDWAFVRLDHARREKVRALERFCDRIHGLARQAARDASVVGCFDINRRYAEMSKRGPVPEDVTTTVKELRKNFERYYIEKYLSFYDILFVNRQGRVFYTIRKEADMNRNLLRGDFEETPLGRCLQAVPTTEAFVDFHDYRPSSKPAAFFVEPVLEGDAVVGWIVLQCAINKVNTLFAWENDLGQTGETFLVNQDGYMLTESNFVGDSTILTKHLDDRNIQAKFAEGRGHREVTDYRGRTALTSFEVVPFLGTRWLVVAKVDQDEIVTRHYERHRRYYAERLLSHLEGGGRAERDEVDILPSSTDLRVDMDEFLKAGHGERLTTLGLSTCTGLLVTWPGRFAYLAHASPRDKIYGADQTNLLGQMVKQVKSFDIRPCEKRRVVFVVTAVHLDSLLAVVDKLVAEGFQLSQIRVAYNPGAETAALSYDYRERELFVTWQRDGPSGRSGMHRMEDTFDIGAIVQGIIREEETDRGV